MFNTSGELNSQRVLSDGEVRDQEIRTNTDLDGDGIVGITLGKQLLDRKGDPNIIYNALSHNGDQGVNKNNADGTSSYIAKPADGAAVTAEWQAYLDWLDQGNIPNPPPTNSRHLFTTSEGLVVAREDSLGRW